MSYTIKGVPIQNKNLKTVLAKWNPCLQFPVPGLEGPQQHQRKEGIFGKILQALMNTLYA